MICGICSLLLMHTDASACTPMPGNNNNFEGRVSNASIIFEGHLIRYEKYEISTAAFPELKKVKDSLPIAVKVFAVDKDWKGAKVGQEIKISPPLWLIEIGGIHSNDKKFKLPEMPKTSEQSIIVLGPKAEFSKEADIIYEGLDCPAESFERSPQYLEILKNKFPAVIQ